MTGRVSSKKPETQELIITHEEKRPNRSWMYATSRHCYPRLPESPQAKRMSKRNLASSFQALEHQHNAK